MIDFSHANSRKQYQKQVEVGHDVAGQVAKGDRRIVGVMIESNLVGGRQDWRADGTLAYGQSITDACIGWDDTPGLLYVLAEGVRARRQRY
jgi:3-deoxy-7-phosphoheptulonate synthase